MKLTVRMYTEEALEGRDYDDGLGLELVTRDFDQSILMRDGESEDNNTSRNFNDIFYIEDLIIAAYNAGKNGEDLEIINEDLD